MTALTLCDKGTPTDIMNYMYVFLNPIDICMHPF